MLKTFVAVGIVLVSGLVANAQSTPAAVGAGSSLTIGANGSAFQMDATTHPWEYGVGAYVDFNPKSYLGLEVEGRSIQFNEVNNLRRDSITGGLRYIYNKRQFAPYAKVLAGIGSGDFPRGTIFPFCCNQNFYRQHDTFTVMTLGGGVDYKLTRRIYVRGEYEYQYWFNYGSASPLGKTGISNPNGFNVGASYRIF